MSDLHPGGLAAPSSLVGLPFARVGVGLVSADQWTIARRNDVTWLCSTVAARAHV
jgi:hypothetical protein